MNNATNTIVSIITFVLVLMGIVAVYNLLMTQRKKDGLKQAIATAVNGAKQAVGENTGSKSSRLTEQQLNEVHSLGDKGIVIKRIQRRVNLILVSLSKPTIPVTGTYDSETEGAINFLIGMNSVSLQDIKNLSVSQVEAEEQKDMILTAGSF